MKKTYDAAIVGLGFVGAADQVSGDRLGQQVENLDGTHIEAYEKNPRIRIIGGSSRDLGRRERFSARSDAPAFDDWRKLIDSSPIDIASVATYAPVHREITEACAAAGVRAIYCEKPIAQRLSDAEAMVTSCKKAGSLLVINHNRRFNAAFRRLRDCFADGMIGEMRSAHLHWGRGRLGNVGTHVFDAARMVLGKKVTAVSGTLDMAGKPDCRGPQFRDPGAWGLLHFEGGMIATVSAPDYGEEQISMEFFGSFGTVSIVGGAISISMFDGSAPEWIDVATDTVAGGKTSMDTAVEEIIAWLDGGSSFPYDATEAAETLEVITAFYISHTRNGAWVDLPLKESDRDIVIHSG